MDNIYSFVQKIPNLISVYFKYYLDEPINKGELEVVKIEKNEGDDL